jgi:hypothetical protein
MTTLRSLPSQTGSEYLPSSFRLTMGRREIIVRRDHRKRFYAVKPFLDFSTGIQPGHLELVVARKWLVVLSKAR